MDRATRKRIALRRVLPFAVPYILGAVLVLAASQVSEPLSRWLVVAGAVLLVLVAPFVTAEAVHGRLAPHPEYLSSWLAFAEEFLARSGRTVSLCALLVATPVLLLVTFPLRLLGVRHGSIYRHVLRAWRALARFDARQFSRALARHRAVAARYGELAPLSLRALERAHYHLALAFLDQGKMAMSERQEGRPRGWAAAQVAEAAAHARMALYYAQTFHLPAERGRDRATMYLVLAESYLAASLQMDAERAARLHEAGLCALSNAAEARWFSSKLQGKPLALGGHLHSLEQLSQEPELQRDARVAATLEMLRSGTTPALAEARAAIRPQPEADWLSQAEREEREWAARLAGAPTQSCAP